MSASQVTLRIKLKIWRQPGPDEAGCFHVYDLADVHPDMSFLEMLDVLNEHLVERGEDPIAFDHDCREGICGMCGAVINGYVHGPLKATTLCQLHMRHFQDGETIIVEPMRVKPFRIVKDLVVDRSSLDRIIRAGGYVSIRTGSAPEAHTIPVSKSDAEEAMDAAACIGCGACAAACPNGSAMLFTAAKVVHLSSLPQGRIEEKRRVLDMVAAMDREGFGPCSNHRECEAACPKSIDFKNIVKLNKLFHKCK